MIKIAIADDHELIRQGIKKLLLSEPDIVLAGEAATLNATLAMLEDQSVDVLVLDLGLDQGAEIQTLQKVRASFPSLPVLVLSAHAEERFAVSALKEGAAGYVSKAMAADQVVMAIRRIGAGGRYITPLVAELLAEELSSPALRPAHQCLTAREQDVLRLLGSGMPVKRVAGQLDISISSVNTYRARIFRKMGLQSNAALIRYAVEHRLTA